MKLYKTGGKIETDSPSDNVSREEVLRKAANAKDKKKNSTKKTP